MEESIVEDVLGFPAFEKSYRLIGTLEIAAQVSTNQFDTAGQKQTPVCLIYIQDNAVKFKTTFTNRFPLSKENTLPKPCYFWHHLYTVCV